MPFEPSGDRVVGSLLEAILAAEIWSEDLIAFEASWSTSPDREMQRSALNVVSNGNSVCASAMRFGIRPDLRDTLVAKMQTLQGLFKAAGMLKLCGAKSTLAGECEQVLAKLQATERSAGGFLQKASVEDSDSGSTQASDGE